MKKVKKLLSKRPNLKVHTPNIPRLRKKKPEDSLQQAIQGIPRITNETVAEHREEVLSSARKYIYPLQHSAHRVVIISISLLIAVIIGFFVYCLLALYKFNDSSTFLYRVTQVIPFPVAKAGPRYVAYENYLFELRHYVHYYQTQQRVDFGSESGKQQLAEFRKRAMDIVVNDAYVKQVAEKHSISVSDRDLEDAIRLVRNQNRLGSNDRVFEDVLKEFWGWSVNDFKRELRQQMLAQKVVAALDTATQSKANEAYAKLQSGADFAAIAKEYSEDTATKDNGGDYGFAISQSDRDLPPQVIDVLFKLKAGEVSEIINTGTTLEIVRVKDVSGDKVTASHIVLAFKPVDTYTDPLRDKNAPQYFISQE
ncbi:MAG TPA: peptidylprolyl isomerase [Candidatus Saccharimonadales bacterium]|nr:peptidylprolyl isomerase [Candidatus Saccharimonadales bacterium]